METKAVQKRHPVFPFWCFLVSRHQAYLFQAEILLSFQFDFLSTRESICTQMGGRDGIHCCHFTMDSSCVPNRPAILDQTAAIAAVTAAIAASEPSHFGFSPLSLLDRQEKSCFGKSSIIRISQTHNHLIELLLVKRIGSPSRSR